MELGCLENRARDGSSSLTDEQIVATIPEAIRNDPLVKSYVLETTRGKESHMHRKKLYHSCANRNAKPEEVLSPQVVERMRREGVRESHIGYVAKTLSCADITVALGNEMIAPAHYINLARMRYMSPDQLIDYSTSYIPKPEHEKDLHDMTRRWTQMEYDILKWNLGFKFGRDPTEEEVTNELVGEILRTGGSHSKNCRAFCVLSHPSWFVKKE